MSKLFCKLWYIYIVNCYFVVILTTKCYNLANYKINNHMDSPSSKPVYQPKIKEIKEAQNSINTHFEQLISILVPLQLAIRNNISVNNGIIDKAGAWNVYKILWENEFVKSLDIQALDYHKFAKTEFTWYIDCAVILWTIIYIYDSSKSSPNRNNSNSRWTHKQVFHNWVYISVIWIDINSKNRGDGVTPTTSLHHELQHHLNVTLWDQLLSNNPNLNFASVNRNAIFPTWFRAQSEFLAKDEEIISQLFWRKVNLHLVHSTNKTEDHVNYINQLYYLDELSASWWQIKGNAIWPKQMFYNNKTPWDRTHYEIIWNNPKDKLDLQTLFYDYLMPWIYLFELRKVLEGLLLKEKSKITTDNISESIKCTKILELEMKIKRISNSIALIVQTLWVSRTVHQALTLVSNVWQKQIVPSLSEDYIKYLSAWREALVKYI